MDAGTAGVPTTWSLIRVSGSQKLAWDYVISVRDTGLSQRPVGDIAEDVFCLTGHPCHEVPTCVGDAFGQDGMVTEKSPESLHVVRKGGRGLRLVGVHDVIGCEYCRCRCGCLAGGGVYDGDTPGRKRRRWCRRNDVRRQSVRGAHGSLICQPFHAEGAGSLDGVVFPQSWSRQH